MLYTASWAHEKRPMGEWTGGSMIFRLQVRFSGCILPFAGSHNLSQSLTIEFELSFSFRFTCHLTVLLFDHAFVSCTPLIYDLKTVWMENKLFLLFLEISFFCCSIKHLLSAITGCRIQIFNSSSLNIESALVQKVFIFPLFRVFCTPPHSRPRLHGYDLKIKCFFV